MDPNEYIKRENLCLRLKGHSKPEIIEELLDILIRSGEVRPESKSALLKELLKREKKASTGLQDEIAIPHAKTQYVENIMVAIGIHHAGIDFQSIDKKPSKIFVITLSPVSVYEAHLKFLTYICNLLKHKEYREKIYLSKNEETLFNLLRSKPR